MKKNIYLFAKRFLQKRHTQYVLIAVLAVALLIGLLVLISHKSNKSLAGKDAEVVLTDYNKQPVRFEQYVSGFSRKPTIVYFWATWCPYCNEEFNNLAAIKQQYGDGVTILAVNRGESVADAKDFTDKLTELGITNLLDPNDALFKKLGGYAMPETVFINSKGEEIFHKHGPITKEEIDEAAKGVVK